MPEPRDNSPSPVPSYRLYRESREEAADFWLHCETIPARTHLHNYEISAHRHDALFQIFLVTEGSGELVGEEASQPFEAPCALFIAPGAVHGFRYRRDVDGIVVTALAERLRTITHADRRIATFATRNNIVPLSGGDDAGRARLALLDIERELELPAPGRVALLEAYMATAIICLARASGSFEEEDDRDAATHRDDERVERFLSLVTTHMREHRPVAFYADRLGVSQTHLNRLIRRSTGLSAQALIARRMLEAARRDLIFTPSPVQKIAYALGFSDPAYFNRFFRRHTGVTPGAYRDEERRRLS